MGSADLSAGMSVFWWLLLASKLLHGYNTSTSRVRRVYFVWQVESLDIVIVAQPLLNGLLTDDVLDGGYILEMSIYVESGIDVEDQKSIGKHNQAVVYNNVPDYVKIVSSEVSGDYIPRLPNTQEECGELLVLVSVSDKLRDHLRSIVRGYFNQKVRLMEVEFQPF
ncbi:hypothetical protein CISG_10225 [Coccidioides immitis RMSCC 3703]|uniref:Uncharacterized protein n=1 Tax=Coccidioides immitis RMSCC 3703 TaxID=454286 RepID=A0A0J8QRF4_COCIT|nr:hypothetical protein CISG_10225 [Coccidioides immitis RMSCC 3703]